MSELVEASVKPSTVKVYKAAFQEFFSWCDMYEYNCVDAVALDEAVVEYMHFCYHTNVKRGQRQKMINLYCALRFYDAGSEVSLPYTKRALKGWNKLVPAAAPVPFIWALVLLIAVQWSLDGMFATSVQLMLLFSGYMRYSETKKLTAADINFPGDVVLAATAVKHPDWGAVFILDSKTGKNQSVFIKQPLIM